MNEERRGKMRQGRVMDAEWKEMKDLAGDAARKTNKGASREGNAK